MLFPAKYTDVVPLDEHGQNASVYEATNQLLGTKAFLKIYPIPNDDPQSALNEPQLLAQLKHAHLVKIITAEKLDPDSDAPDVHRLLLEMELCAGPSLKGCLDTCDQSGELPSVHWALDRITECCHGLHAMHESNYLHCDIKPANIMLDGDLAKVTDLGLARKMGGDGRAGGSRHARLYRPPEVWAGQGYSVRSDIYQLGLVLYQLLGGSIDYAASAFDDEELALHIAEGGLVNLKSLGPHLDKQLEALLKKCLGPEEDRFESMMQLVIALNAVKHRQPDYSLVKLGNGVQVWGRYRVPVRYVEATQTAKGYSCRVMAQRPDSPDWRTHRKARVIQTRDLNTNRDFQRLLKDNL